MKTFKFRVYHCSADEGGTDHTLMYYDKMHRNRGFKMIGYHFLVHPDGRVDIGRPLDMSGAHAKGYNKNPGICYVGGLRNGKPADTRTPQQIIALRAIDAILEGMQPDSERVGHRDLSVDLNGDGVISKNEWMKSCPCFDVKTEF